MLHNNNIFL